MYLQGKISTNLAELNPYACASFYAVDRYIQYVKKMKAYLEQDDNTIILLDRYLSANIIHQGAKFETSEERHRFIKWVYEYECELLGLPKEDYTLVLMINPIASQRLLSERYGDDDNKKDIHESNLEYLTKCHDRLFETVGYINATELANWGTLVCNDADNNVYSIEHIHEMIYDLVKKNLVI
jgi:dTMP kinase